MQLQEIAATDNCVYLKLSTSTEVPFEYVKKTANKIGIFIGMMRADGVLTVMIYFEKNKTITIKSIGKAFDILNWIVNFSIEVWESEKTFASRLDSVKDDTSSVPVYNIIQHDDNKKSNS